MTDRSGPNTVQLAVSRSTYLRIVVTQYTTEIEKVVSLSLCDGHSGTCVPLLSSLAESLIVCMMLGYTLSPKSMRAQ